MKQITSISSIWYLVLAAGIMASVSSCYVSGPPVQKKTVVVKKKPHPHGGPPGQMKKSPGHPGKRH